MSEREKDLYAFNWNSTHFFLQDFDAKWKENKVPGWTKEKSAKMLSNPAVPLNLSQYNSIEDIEALGMDRLKSALMALNLKCGGLIFLWFYDELIIF